MNDGTELFINACKYGYVDIARWAHSLDRVGHILVLCAYCEAKYYHIFDVSAYAHWHILQQTKSARKI